MIPATDLIEQFPLPPAFTEAEMNALLVSAHKQGVSDITIQSDDQIWVERHGRHRPITGRVLGDTEVKAAITYMYGSNATGILSGGGDINRRYEITVDRQTRVGFRMNATSSRVGSVAKGLSITLRTLPDIPPPLETLDLPEGITGSLFPRNGAIFIVGRTGDGKSTLMASAIRHLLEHEEDWKILTYEEPIEFLFDRIPSRCPKPSQVEIGVHLLSWREGIANALRRKPSLIMFQEARNVENMETLIEAALTGHTTYSTVHAETVAETILRIINLFPYDAQSAAASKVLGCLRMVVAQKLVKSLDGKRVALREWLVFDRAFKERLEVERFERWPSLIRAEIALRQCGMKHAAERAHAAGLIDRATFLDAAGIQGDVSAAEGSLQ
jgi:defect-in-organelle-trafficking protein DotB